MTTGRRLAEAVPTAALAGAMGASVGWLVGLAIPAGVIAALNGAISGWRGIYRWRSVGGVVAFILDSTWSLLMTTAALFANTVALFQRDSGYVAQLSSRQNRHVHQRGFMPRKGFAITLGNVICGAGNVVGPGDARRLARRRRLVTDHEDVHVWQARWFGPAYPFLYVGWTILAGAAGMVIWLLRKRDQRFTKVVESSAYYLNPLEWWAYSRDDHWPPNGKVADFGWKRPCCRPMSEVRLHR